MSISKKDIKLLLYVGGILLLIAGYFLGYQHFAEIQVTLDEENVNLQSQVVRLNDIYMNQEMYIEQTQTFNQEIQAIYESFPAEVREEDAILYGRGLEKDYEMKISSIGISKANQFYLLGSAVSGTDTAAADAETDEELMDTTGETTDTTTTSEETPVTTGQTVDAALGLMSESSVQLPQIALFDTAVTYDFSVGYEDCKSVFAAILACADKRNIPSISLSYDGESGKLVGNMSVNMYYIAGTDEEYEELERELKKSDDYLRDAEDEIDRLHEQVDDLNEEISDLEKLLKEGKKNKNVSS